MRQAAGTPAGTAASGVTARFLYCLSTIIAFTLLLPSGVFAEGLPQEAERFLQQSNGSSDDFIHLTLDKLLDLLWGWAASGIQPALQFAAQAAGYLLLAGILGLLLSRQRTGILEPVAVLGFGAISLAALTPLLTTISTTAQDCCNYLAGFIPVYSGVAAIGGQPSAALVYSGMFYSVSGFLSAAIQRLLLPLLQMYFCLAVCACVWGSSSMSDAAALFSRCIKGILKLCGAGFSLVLGLQNLLASTADSAALRTGKSFLQGAIPVVGDAAAAALTGAASAVHLLQGSLALAALAALAALFVPVLVQSMAYALAFAAVGIIAGALEQKSCARLCRLHSEGAQLCGSALVLYFFMVFLSTALLLLTGNGGIA